MQGRLERITEIKPLFIHCCINNCIAFTGEYVDATECPHCDEKRFVSDTVPPARPRARKQFLYIPIADRLRLQYRNANRARVLSSYRHNFTQENSPHESRDVFDGGLYHKFHLDQLRLFQDPRDVAFHMSLDGVQLTNMGHHEVTPVILVNLNLPPTDRYKIENILASMIIPGPKKPKDLDTFLRPLVDELKQLDCGVDAFDASTGSSFTLKAWVTIVTGDGPGIADAIGFKRPGNAYRPCRSCMIKGEKGELTPNGRGTYYVPHTSYNFDNPPLRKYDALRNVIDLVVESQSDDMSKRFGITRASILLELRSVHFTRSFPIDIMHCVLLNITETLFKLWNRKKFDFEKDSPPSPSHLSTESTEAIGKSIAAAREDIPTYLTRSPRRIDKHYKGYKAAEWEAWLRYYGIPLLDQNLGDEYVDNFRQLSQIYSLATKYTITEADISLLERITIDFVKKFEELYYRQEKKRLPVCSVNIHYLVHLVFHIRDCGPARYWWQFPMERYCGIIKPMARSKSQLNVSLANGVIVAEHLHHIQFFRDINMGPQAECSYPALLDPFQTDLTNYSKRLLTAYIPGNNSIEFYKRCQLNRDLIVGSQHSQRRDDINRQNNRVCYQFPNQQSFMFATVLKFVQVIRQQRCLAWVRNYDGVDIDHVKRVASFAREGSYCWIEAAWIKSVFGIMREGGINLIITDVNLFD
jgi:Transposase family tnp2/Domain of unknown function (DUF4218)